MENLLKSKLFSLLSDSSQITNEEVQRAYGDFTEQVKAINLSENDYVKVFRILNLSRIELDSLCASPLYGQGKKCLEICLS